jgi:hypothetical protein
MTVSEALALIEGLMRMFPAVLRAIGHIARGEPEAQHVRDILAERSESARAADEIRAASNGREGPQ